MAIGIIPAHPLSLPVYGVVASDPPLIGIALAGFTRSSHVTIGSSLAIGWPLEIFIPCGPSQNLRFPAVGIGTPDINRYNALRIRIRGTIKDPG